MEKTWPYCMKLYSQILSLKLEKLKASYSSKIDILLSMKGLINCYRVLIQS